MLCPVCKTQTLQTAERHGIEIDYCPGCRVAGSWRAGQDHRTCGRRCCGTSASARQAQPASTPPPVMHRDTRHLGQRYEDNRGHGYKKKKKESFLSELFDF